MLAINIKTGAYPLTAPDIIAAHPECGFPVPFELPDGYAWVSETAPPGHDQATHQVVEGKPKKVKRVWTQQWDVVPLTGPEVEERAALKAGAVKAAQAAAHARISKWRDEQEAGSLVFEHAGQRWDGGLVVRQRLQPLLSLPEVPLGFFWTDADNVDTPVTAAELHALAQAHEVALIGRGFEIHKRQRAMKEEVAAMDRPEEIEHYKPGWSDQLLEQPADSGLFYDHAEEDGGR